MDLETFIYPIFITLIFSSIAAFYYGRTFFKKDIAMAVVLYSLLVFCIVYFVSFENNLGLGIGLLGILSLIRLRSTLDNLIDIGFVFFAITIGLLNASITDIWIIVSVNSFLTVILCLLASGLVFRRQVVSSKVIFDDVAFEHLNDMEYLKKRVRKHLKIDPLAVSVVNVNYLKDSVTLRVTYEIR